MRSDDGLAGVRQTGWKGSILPRRSRCSASINSPPNSRKC